MKQGKQKIPSQNSWKIHLKQAESIPKTILLIFNSRVSPI